MLAKKFIIMAAAAFLSSGFLNAESTTTKTTKCTTCTTDCPCCEDSNCDCDCSCK